MSAHQDCDGSKNASSGFSMTMRAGAVRLVALVLGWAPLAAIAGSGSADELLRDLQSVIDDLRKGGLIIYLRHTATDEVARPDQTADLSRCETQRNLSAHGRAQAVEIGKAIKELGIP